MVGDWNFCMSESQPGTFDLLEGERDPNSRNTQPTPLAPIQRWQEGT